MKSNGELKKLKKELSAYNSVGVLFALRNEKRTEVEDFIRYALKRTENIIIFDKDKRMLRNEYFLSIAREFTGKELGNKIEHALSDIHYSEILFDEISESLEKFELSKKSLAIQIWSHINSIGNKIDFITTSIKEAIRNEENIVDFHSSSVTLKDEDGDEFQADFAMENLVEALSKTLNMLAHKNDLYSDGFLTIPGEVSTSSNNEGDAYDIAVKAISWKHLEIASSSCLLFDGEIFHRTKEQLFDLERDNGVVNTYHFLRDNIFERVDFIANERLLGITSQSHIEGVITHGISGKVITEISKRLSIAEDVFLCEDEASSFNYLFFMLGMNIQSINISFGGLTLREWVRCYAYVKYLAHKGVRRKVYEYPEIKRQLSMVGVDDSKIDIFLSFASFNKKSRDLYDSPFIKTLDGALLLIAEPFISANLINIISSVFSSYELVSLQKGLGFEERVLDLFKKTKQNAKSFKFKRGRQEYEYDAVLLMGNRLFVIECKNSSLSYGVPDMAFRKIKFFDEAAEQAHRLVNGLIENPEVVYEKFGVSVSELEIIPVIVNCMPFSWAGLYNGVYITDISSISVLLKNKYLTYSVYSEDKIERYPLRNQWAGHEVTGDDLIAHFHNPPQLVEYLNATRFSSTWYPVSQGTFYCDKRLSTDKHIFSSNRKQILGEEDV